MENQLFYGDNLEILRGRIKDDSYDLVYIDPPFNSKRNYNQIYNNIGGEDRAQAQAFTDMWVWDNRAQDGFTEILTNHERRFSSQLIELMKGLRNVLKEGSLLAYLISIALRVVELRRVLKSNGSFYLHCDPTASHYLKLVLDSIFVAQGGDFRNEIIWQRTNAHNFKSKRFARIHDVLLYYTKSRRFYWKPLYTEYSEEQLSRYKTDKNGRLYKAENLTMSGGTRKFKWRGSQPPAHRSWGYDEDDLERLWAEGRILLKKDGTPRLDGWKIYLDDTLGKPLSDIWNDVGRVANTAGVRLGYPTQKPDDLLERIIQANSPEGGSVLDAYCGCGTTIAVAEKLGRTWTGIDITYQSIAIVLTRLSDPDKVVLDGIPRDMDSATALAKKKDDRLRKEFEKWAILTFTNNMAVIHEKKGADAGIDGIAYFLTSKTDNDKVVIQAKSGGVARGHVATLRGDMEREKAAMAALVTLEPPTKPMLEEAKAAGRYYHSLMQRHYDRIQIVTVKEILEQNRRLEIPLSADVLRASQITADENQLELGVVHSPAAVAALRLDQAAAEDE